MTPRDIIVRAIKHLNGNGKSSSEVLHGKLAELLDLSPRTLYRYRHARTLRDMPLGAGLKLAELAKVDIKEIAR